MNITMFIIWIFLTIYFMYEAYKIKNIWNKKKWTYWVITRVCIIFFLFLCSINLTLKMHSTHNTTVFLVDNSLSVNKHKKSIEQYINSEINKKRKSDKIAVISFAKDRAIELPLTYEKRMVTLSSNLNRNFTNFEKAIDFSIDYFPRKDNRRLVLITDKKQNLGDVNKIKNKLISKNINLVVKEVEKEVEKDVQINQVKIPKNLYKQNSIPVQVEIYSNYKDKGKIYFYINDKKSISKDIGVNKGNNTFNVSLPVKDLKKLVLKTEIDFKGDENIFNNVYTLEKDIVKEPKVLVIGDGDNIKNINLLLDGMGIKRENYSPNTVVNSVNFLSDFNEIIMVNTDYNSLPKGFDENLSKAIKEFGTGFFAVGGDKSFALGNYKNTKLEEILPVSCNMKNKRKQANTGLVLLIDCSGSMNDETGGIKKIELAKKGAIEAIKALEKEDYIGVLAFSDTLEWIVPFQKAENKDKLVKDVSKLSSKGGTLIIPGLVDGINKIKSAPVKVKHMILLTDGQAEKNGFDKYVEEMKKNNITISTLGVGEDCDKDVLNYLSKSSGGRQYFSKDFTDVPKIMSKETKISQKKYINNEMFIPKENDGLFNQQGYKLPKLKGYMGTGIKKEAKLILQSQREDPILATWNYGIGKVGVWTSDLDGKWSNQWINWQGFSKYFGNIIDYFMKDKGGKYIKMDLINNGANVQILAKCDPKLYDKDIRCKAIYPNNKEQDVEMILDKNQTFKGIFKLNEQGRYKFIAYIKDKDTIMDSVEKSIYLDYSPEFKINNNDYSLDEVILQCNGKYLESDENVFKQPIITKNINHVELDFIFMPLVFLLFLLDIYLRIKY